MENMKELTKINDNFYRLITPYVDIFTSVYFIKTEEGVLIFDTASGEGDVDSYILPAMKEVGISLEDVKFIFISHNHKDHARGLKRLMEIMPRATIVSRSDKLQEDFADYSFIAPDDSTVIMSCLKVVTITGHTLDCSAIYDMRTKTLITGDCLQLYGIYGSGDWGCNVNFIPEHFEAVEKVRLWDIETVYTAHDYHPLGYKFVGKKQINDALDFCKKPLLEIKDIIENNPQLDDAEVRLAYNASANLPTVNVKVVAAVRKAIVEGKI
jgi:glyoxylase-like metal-dependent hydrolase (beta-lactamase superfamily II)